MALPFPSRRHVSPNAGQDPTSSHFKGIGTAATRTFASREAGSITAKSTLVFLSVGKISVSIDSRCGVGQLRPIFARPAKVAGSYRLMQSSKVAARQTNMPLFQR